MRTEVMVCRKCCFCIPLRHGLITWGYLRLILACLLLFSVSFTLERFTHYHITKSDESSDIVIAILVIIVVIADIVLGIIFIFGCHKKNAVLIKKYYYYNLFLLALFIPMALYSFGWWLYYMFKNIEKITPIVLVVSEFVATFGYMFVQVYVTLLVRSQLIKLNDSCQFRFENKASEAECSMDKEGLNGETMRDINKAVENNEDDEIRNYVY